MNNFFFKKKLKKIFTFGFITSKIITITNYKCIINIKIFIVFQTIGIKII